MDDARVRDDACGPVAEVADANDDDVALAIAARVRHEDDLLPRWNVRNRVGSEDAHLLAETLEELDADLARSWIAMPARDHRHAERLVRSGATRAVDDAAEGRRWQRHRGRRRRERDRRPYATRGRRRGRHRRCDRGGGGRRRRVQYRYGDRGEDPQHGGADRRER